MTRTTKDLNAFHNVHADFFFYSPEKINEMYESNADISEDDLEFIRSLASQQRENEIRVEEWERAEAERASKLPPIKTDEFGNDYREVYDEWSGWHRAYISHEMGQ